MTSPVTDKTTDLRSQLASSGAPRVEGANVEPQYFEFDRMEPTITTKNGGRQWWTRSQAIIVAYLELGAGDTVTIDDQPDEYMIIVPESAGGIVVRAGEQRGDAGSGNLVVVPPGDSTIEAAATSTTPTTVVAIFSTQSEKLRARCTNNSFYDQPDANVADWAPWPAGHGGDQLRIYDTGGVGYDRKRLGRIYRCSTIMVNWTYETAKPRDTTKLSPHHHDDFEQISLQLSGDYVHHIRTPWTKNMADWRDDEHRHTISPSVTVIPPPSIHTSAWVGDMPHQLIDVFAPPRFDFSSKPGWVLNESDYPMPEQPEASR